MATDDAEKHVVMRRLMMHGSVESHLDMFGRAHSRIRLRSESRRQICMSVNDESQNLSMNEEVGVSLPSSNEVRGMAARKKRARTSVVWTTFEDFDEGPDQGRRAKCKKCGTILKCDSGTVQDGLKKIHPSVIKIREGIKYIKGSEVRKQRFLQCVSQVGLGGSRRGLRQDMPTRWNLTYLMLDGALYYRSALMNLAVSDSSFKWCPSDEEWDKIEKINKFLGEFYEVTVLFSGTKYPTSNLFFPKVLVVQHSIQEAIASEDSFLSRMGKEMDLKFKKYWSDYSLILGIAVVMDPRFKMEFVEWAYEKLYGRESSQLKVFTDTLSSLFGAYKETSTHQSSSYHIHESLSQIQGKPCILQEFDARYKSGQNSSLKTELNKYLDEVRLDNLVDLDVLAWWKMERHRYPILSQMARDVLTILVSTVASESAFSIGGRVLDEYRSSLLPETVQALLCTRDWIFGKKKEKKMVEVDDFSEDILGLRMHDRIEEEESFT
ncbi:zinc finger BED domain-containing protein DAYSLEEPER-like [Argentina anserina]|uniref:zinc finger BED domain-containing protein DAYSLEEPER-like n=1 Tax=Argentina anserina TaxID=57926 RepID=UPI0021768319|nr:zinc finger BED domain-containing protein DAYSLEEPER-like [Potentilla anserina]